MMFKHFTYYSEYDTNDFSNGFLERGKLYAYISSTFLNGFINYVKPVKAFLLDRYRTFDQGRFDKALSQFHTNLKDFDDDVLILAQSENNPNVKWFFWFDCDVSDCCIGIFCTNVDQHTLIIDFEEYVKSLVMSEPYRTTLEKTKKEDTGSEGITGFTEIPVDKLRGWVSF